MRQQTLWGGTLFGEADFANQNLEPNWLRTIFHTIQRPGIGSLLTLSADQRVVCA